MKVDYLVQQCKDKASYLMQFMKEMHITKDEMGYLGDDLNDLPPMQLCGFAGCPEDACEEIKKRADYVSCVKGGYGAVRDIAAWLLKERGQWEEAIKDVYGTGV